MFVEIMNAILGWFEGWAGELGWLTEWLNDLIITIGNIFKDNDWEV
ncbi:MAG: hypothetical protein FWG82_02780 [Oscillospiraceae bacterium]|nr:hypothetical protein [Oscillospiraceae bacterium]